MLKLKIGIIAFKYVEKKLETYENNIVTFAKHMEGVCEHFDDVVVELNNKLGNITAESKDNLLEKTFNNPSLGFKCDFCDFTAKTERVLKTHNNSRKHCCCDLCDYICKDEKGMKKHKFDKHPEMIFVRKIPQISMIYAFGLMLL